MPFQNPLALAALLSVIPLIIIYMLRPKPAVLSIPSLMFILKLERERKGFMLLSRKSCVTLSS
ncbi:BatA domain-containing protein [Methanosarcina horonobensis]|uniref:BatA domain-containing protein n=1 Tax=Methanosarcina horonobensis TaxID=418008 RepID=UPI000ADCCE7C|nr:BatA domain-containing protein [Methanosarcina horonobensis]